MNQTVCGVQLKFETLTVVGDGVIKFSLENSPASITSDPGKSDIPNETDKSMIVFLFYRSAAVISIDELLFPTWFVKLASFYGLGFIRYGDVSCFIWYFCSKSVINMLLSSFESTKKLSNQSEMPDLLANLVQPKLD